jgi:hypothetical protein
MRVLDGSLSCFEAVQLLVADCFCAGVGKVVTSCSWSFMLGADVFLFYILAEKMVCCCVPNTAMKFLVL